MKNNIIFFKSWILFFLTWAFLSYLSKLILTFPVGIALIFMGLSSEAVKLVTIIGGILCSMIVSFVFFKWIVIHVLMPSLEKEMLKTTEFEPCINEQKDRSTSAGY